MYKKADIWIVLRTTFLTEIYEINKKKLFGNIAKFSKVEFHVQGRMGR